MKRIVLLFSLATLLSACQDVIYIDVDSIHPKLVIDGALTDTGDNFVVKLSKSVDYFDAGIYPTVSDALITITDNEGISTQLDETSPGEYSSNLTVAEGNEYILKVRVESKEYAAHAEMPYKVEIDTVTCEPTPEYMEFSGGYLVNCHLSDPAGTENYYRLKVSNINGLSAADDIIYVYDDAFVNGNEITMRWEDQQFFPNDTVVVELQTLAKSTYDYYRTLASLFEGGMIGNANPANPVTNLSVDVLGYFGAYTISSDTIIISE